MGAGSFEGFSRRALDFYAEVERENSREWWLAHKPLYEADVRAPITALVGALEPDFGVAHVFRPNRDVRFAADKAPYKTHQGAYCATADKAYYYVQIDADGLLVGAGGYRFAADQLGRYRTAVSDDLAGPDLERILSASRADGLEVGGEQSKSRPRGVAADHPRLELLRHKSIHLSRGIGDPDWVFGPEALPRIRAEWERLRAFTGWLDQHVGATEIDDRFS